MKFDTSFPTNLVFKLINYSTKTKLKTISRKYNEPIGRTLNT